MISILVTLTVVDGIMISDEVSTRKPLSMDASYQNNDSTGDLFAV